MRQALEEIGVREPIFTEGARLFFCAVAVACVLLYIIFTMGFVNTAIVLLGALAGGVIINFLMRWTK
jgi:xanthine/uracil permease